MDLLFQFPWFFLVFVAAVLLFLIIATASQSRGYSARTQQRLCSGCGQSHPPFAAYCKRCGRQLDPTSKIT